MITTKRSTRGVKILVINYTKYQGFYNYQTTDTTTKKPLRNHLETTTIDKNEKNEKKIGLASPTTRKSIKFPKSDYDRVIKKYEELKGVQFSGKEYEPIQQSIKTMFMSSRSADDIIRCMGWFAEKSKSGDKKYVWTENWTINTIKIKLPEFLAKKLDGDDEALFIPSYAKGYIK